MDNIHDSESGGTMILVEHDNGMATQSMHTGATVAVGARVQAGTPIGVSDGSGAGDPHLHFQVWPAGVPRTPGNTIDPTPFLDRARGVTP